MIYYNYTIHLDNGETPQLNKCREQIPWSKLSSNATCRVELSEEGKYIILNMSHVMFVEEHIYDDDPQSYHNIIRALEHNNYDGELTCKELGISERTLWRKAKQYSINVKWKD